MSIRSAYSQDPCAVSMMRRDRPVPTIYVFVPCNVNQQLRLELQMNQRGAYFSRILAKDTKGPWTELFAIEKFGWS